MQELLHPFQSEYRRKYSCNTALARLTNSWLTTINKYEVSGVVFVDLKKTFDLVDHDIPLKKLTIYLKTLPFFKPSLHNITQCVILHGSYSSKESVKYGVPQVFLLMTFFNAALLHTYIHGAPEDMRHWYSQHFIRHKHGMNEHTGKREVDESISLRKKKKVCKAPTWKRNLNHAQFILAWYSSILYLDYPMSYREPD